MAADFWQLMADHERQEALYRDGFRLGARVLEFAGRIPGDIGLFLT
jgi:hypothetical protein